MKGLLNTIRRVFSGSRSSAPTPSAKPATKPSAHKPTARPRSPMKVLRSHLSVVPRSLDGGQPVFTPQRQHRPARLRGKANRRKAARKARHRRRRA